MLGVTLLLVAMEGLICILVAAPFAAGLAFFGGLLGYAIQSTHWMSRNSSAMLFAVLFFLPATFGVERMAQPTAPRFVVRSAIEINASPPLVWRHVVALAGVRAHQKGG
jgi:hypothetical protein